MLTFHLYLQRSIGGLVDYSIVLDSLSPSIDQEGGYAGHEGVFITIEEPFCVVLLVITGGIDAFIRIVPRPVGRLDGSLLGKGHDAQFLNVAGASSKYFARRHSGCGSVLSER